MKSEEKNLHIDYNKTQIQSLDYSVITKLQTSSIDFLY